MSSSPSYLVLQSLDDARAWMDERGAAALAETVRLCEQTRCEIARMPGLLCQDLGDPTRLYVGTAKRGLSGWSAYRQLREMGVELELADANGVLAIATVFDRAEDFGRLTDALGRLEGDGSALPDLPAPVYGEPCASLRAAVLARTRRVELKAAAGEISARSVGAYPPGSAIVAPGERFTEAAIDFLLRTESLGASLFGVEAGFVEAADKEDALHALI
jgi:arginine/lysine/ornithine decarboxylase